MGDKILKKVYIFVLFFYIIAYGKVFNEVNYDNLNVKKYDMIFEKIAKKRVGLSDSEIEKVRSPFVTQNILKIIKNKNIIRSKHRNILRLYGILNNKVKINKKWYKIGSKIDGYRLVKIKNSSVVLKKKRKKLELFLRKRNDKIQITKIF